MMSAPTGGRLKVIGSSIAIAASGPMPGSTPTSVPTITPMKQYIRLIGETAVLNPSVRLGKCSARNSMSVAPPEHRVRQLETPDEETGGREHQDRGQDDQFQRAEPPDGKRADHDHQGDRWNEPEVVLHRHAVDQEGGEERDHRAPGEAGYALALYPRRHERDDGADHHHDAAEPRGEIPRPHAHGRAHGVVPGDDDGGQAEADEHQAGPEVFLTLDAEFHDYSPRLQPGGPGPRIL